MKKTLAWLLTLCMILSMIPMSVFAIERDVGETYYLICYDSDQTTELGRIPVEYGSQVDYFTFAYAGINPGNKEGMYFSRWAAMDGANYDVCKGNGNSIFYMPAMNLRYYASWAANDYLLTFKSDDKVVYNAYINYNSDITNRVPTLTKEGYDFVGWDVDNDGVADEVVTNMPAKNLTYTAIWTPAERNYTIYTYYMGIDGKYSSYTSETATGIFGTEVTVTPDEVEGFTLDTDKSELSGTVANDGSLVLNVYYSRNRNKVSWIVDSVTYQERDVMYGEVLMVPTPTKGANGCTTYTFSGWDEEIPETMPDYSLTFNGSFTEGIEHVGGTGYIKNEDTHTPICNTCEVALGESVAHTYDESTRKCVCDAAEPITYVAQIGETKYETLQAAIAAVKNGETITFLTDISEDVTIKQTANLSFTIDGAKKTYKGTMAIDGNKRSTGAETLTIKNVNFVAEGKWQASIDTVKSQYAHNITVDGCTFTGTGEAEYATYGIYLRHSYNIIVQNTTGTKMYDLVYGNTAVTGFTAENVTVTDSAQGIWLSYVNSTATFKNLNMTGISSVGIGIKNNAKGSATIEGCTIEAAAGAVAFDPNTQNDFTLYFKGTNNLTNDEGNWLLANLNGSKLIVNLTEATYLNVNNISYGGLPYRAVLVDANVPNVYTFEKFVPTITLDDVKNQVSIKGACDHVDGTKYSESTYLEKEYTTLGDVTWNGTAYTCTVTFALQEYLEECIAEQTCTYTHTVPADSPETITYVATYDSAKSEWTITDGPWTVEFAGIKNVTYKFDCTDPTPAITLSDVYKLVFVQVSCNHQDGEEFRDATYLEEEYTTLGEVTWNGTAYTCPVTFALQKYLEECIADQTCTCIHSIPDKYLGTAEYVVTYDSNAQKWTYTEYVGGVKTFTYKFDCTKPVAQIGDTTYGSIYDAVNAAQDGDTITVIADHEVDCSQVTNKSFGGQNTSVLWNITKDITLDLNGKTVTVTNTIPTNGTTLAGIVYAANGADVVVTGNGAIWQNDSDGWANLFFADNGSTLTVKNGTYTCDPDEGVLSNYMLYAGGGLLTIEGGTYTHTTPGYKYIFNVANGKQDIVVKGGTFTKDPATEREVTIPEGYTSVDNGNGTWTVREAHYVAQVVETGVKYESLQEALNACTNGETVKLLVDITYTEDDVVSAHGGGTGFGNHDASNPSIIYTGGTKGVTDAENQPSNVNAVLDLNGHTITNNADAYLFLIMDNAKLTFKDSVGNGSITGTTEAPVIWAVGTDTLVTIESGKYTTANATGLLWSTHGADMVITGGEFSTTADDASLLIVRNEKDLNNPSYFCDSNATITVKGGTYYGFNPEKMMDDSTNPFTEFNACADGYYAIDNGDGSWTVSDDYVAWIKAELLAGRSVTLEKDITVTYDYVTSEPCTANGNGQYYNWGIFTVINGDVTFDLNDHSVTFEDHSTDFCNNVQFALFYANNGAKLTIVGEGDITVNGMATGAYSTTVGSKLIIEGGNWLNNPCTECGAYNIFLYASHGGELYIKDGKFEQNVEDSYLIVEHTGNVSNMDALVDYSKTVIEITGGTFVGMNPEEAHSCNQVTWSKQEWGTTNVVADGYYAIAVEGKDNTWTIGEAVAVNVQTGKGYGDVSDALDAAKSGETVKLLKDCEESMVVITKGVTLDLNGNTLIADYLVAFNGNHVVDSAETKGLLKINQNNISLPEDNAQMPVYNGTDGYVFITVKMQATVDEKNVTEDGFKIQYRPSFGAAYNTKFFADGAADNDVQFIIRLSWTNEEGIPGSQDFVFTEALVQGAYANGKTMDLTVSGVGEYTNLKATAVLVSDTGVELTQDVYVFNPAE